MIKLLVMLVILLLILLLCYLTSKKIILTPQFTFTLAFIPSIFLCLFYVDKWLIDLSINTVLVIIGGVLLFFIISLITEKALKKYDYSKSLKQPKEHKRINSIKEKINSLPFVNDSLTINNIARWKLIVFIIIQFITILCFIYFILNLGESKSLSDAIYAYRYATLFQEEEIEIPRLLRNLRLLFMAAGYVWAYLLVHGIIYNRCKNSNYILLGINYIFSIVLCTILGSRTEAIRLVIATVVMFYFIWGQKNHWEKKIPLKAIIIICVIGVALVGTFQIFGNLLGRNSTSSFIDYIALYLSGEIVNLDTFIRIGDFGADINTTQTLRVLVNDISNYINYLGIEGWYHYGDLPFYYVNGYNLGNVCTTFYAFIYDGGYIGVVIFTILMAIGCQLFYHSCIKHEEMNEKHINIYLINYSYVFFAIIFSFFSPKFYEMILSINFIKYIIFFIITKFFIEKFDLSFLRKYKEINKSIVEE